MAEKFARDAFNGQTPAIITKDLSGAGSWLAKLPDGTVSCIVQQEQLAPKLIRVLQQSKSIIPILVL